MDGSQKETFSAGFKTFHCFVPSNSCENEGNGVSSPELAPTLLRILCRDNQVGHSDHVSDRRTHVRLHALYK